MYAMRSRHRVQNVKEDKSNLDVKEEVASSYSKKYLSTFLPLLLIPLLLVSCLWPVYLSTIQRRLFNIHGTDGINVNANRDSLLVC